LQQGSRELFAGTRAKEAQAQEAQQAKLYEEIGRLKMELEWLKKLPDSADWKRQRIDARHPPLSVRRQCQLLGLSRTGWYYTPAGESAENLQLMRLIDEQYTRTPFYGSRRMTVILRGLGYAVNRKRVQRLMRLMGLEGVAPGLRTSHAPPEHPVYPYLRRDRAIERPNQVWASDITYIPRRIGFMYLMAILDWYSRYVVA
jgi:putative transposase